MANNLVYGVAVFAGAANALAFWSPKATDFPVIPPDAQSPRPTPAPVFHDLRRRQSGSTDETFLVAPDNTCGYVSGLAGAAYTCGALTVNCVFITAQSGYSGAAGCCDATECAFRATCMDYVQISSSGLCDNGCMVDTYTVKCTDTSAQYCNTISFPGDIIDYFCDSLSISTPQLAFTTYSGETSRTFSDLVFTGSSAISLPSESSIPSSSSSTTIASSSTTSGSGGSGSGGSSTPIGAIVGGVVGGLAVIAGVILAVFFILRSQKKKKQTPQAAPPPSQQPGGDYPPMQQTPQPPGGHQSMYVQPGAVDPNKMGQPPYVQNYPMAPGPNGAYANPPPGSYPAPGYTLPPAELQQPDPRPAELGQPETPGPDRGGTTSPVSQMTGYHGHGSVASVPIPTSPTSVLSATTPSAAPPLPLGTVHEAGGHEFGNQVHEMG